MLESVLQGIVIEDEIGVRRAADGNGAHDGGNAAQVNERQGGFPINSAVTLLYGANGQIGHGAYAGSRPRARQLGDAEYYRLGDRTRSAHVGRHLPGLKKRDERTTRPMSGLSPAACWVGTGDRRHVRTTGYEAVWFATV